MTTARITLLFCMLACYAALPFSHAQNALDGQWRLTASPYGTTGDGGIGTTTWETIDFTATLSADGTRLDCHADNFYARGSRPYPMDWQMAVERDGSKVRLGWVFNADQPASSVEFQEPASAYALFGTDAVEGEHRYIYLLTYDIDNGTEGGMTVWSTWTDNGQGAFVLPQNQQIDAIVSTTIPFTTMIGYVDSWASARIERIADTAITAPRTTPHTAANATAADAASSATPVLYDLQGRPVATAPQPGIYIVGGRKVVIK